jgi:hypothetical protein
MWKLIDISDDEFSKWVNVDCAYLIDGSYCDRDCQHNCDDGRLKWLKQEHEGSDCR